MVLADDHILAYVCGHQTVVMNTESREQSFIPGATQPYVSLGITTLAASISKKFIAVADKADPVAAVTFYDSQTLRRKKVLHYNELGSREIKCVAFSEDGKLCLTQGGSPEWNLVLWNVEKMPKVMGTVKISMSDETPVHQVSFCPWDPSVIVVFGKSIARLFRYADGQLRPASLSLRREHANFISHMWLGEDKLIIGTEMGEILLVDNLEFRAVVYPTGADSEEITPILCFAPTSRGFVCGTTGGEIRYFDKQDEIKEHYQLVEPSFHLPREKDKDKASTMHHPLDKGNIIALAMGADDALICQTDSQQIYVFSQNHSGGGGGKENSFSFLLSSFHSPNAKGESAITGIDCALWRPIAATCGKDCTVRVWNLADRKIEIMKEFEDEPTTLSVHPAGLYIVVGFTERIRLLAVLLDDLHTCKDFPVRHCTYVKFARGGQYFAAVSGSNIHLFNTYTGAQIGIMRGHTGRPRALIFSNYDSKLLSIGAEGNVFVWDVMGCVRKPEQYAGITPFQAGAALQDGSKAFAATSDRIVREVTFQAKTAPNVSDPTATDNSKAGEAVLASGAKDVRDLDVGRTVSQMILDDNRQVLIVGTGDDDRPGGIVSVMTSSNNNSVFDSIDVHAGPVTALCISNCGSMLISGDTQGTIVISEFEGVIARSTVKPREGTASYELIEEVLIHRSELESRKAKLNELSLKVDELNQNNTHQLKKKEMEHDQKIEDITHKFTTQLNSEHEKYRTVLTEKQQVELEYGSTMQSLYAKQEAELNAVNTKYKAKLNNEASRHKQLAGETEEMHKRWTEENRALVESHQGYLQQLTEEYEAKSRVEHDMQKALHAEKDSMQVNFEVQRSDVDFDADSEIDAMKAKYESRLAMEESLGIELMANHAIMKKNLQMLNKDADQQKEEIRRLKDKETRLLETIRSLEKDIQSHKKEIREREETITDKEKRIFDLKKKNQELEKFRFVLDYKIKELKLQIAPRENDIATMRKQIEEMDLELDQYHKSNQSLNLMIGELKLKLDGLRRELESQEHRVAANALVLDKLKRDIQEAWECRDNYGMLKPKIVNLYRIYVQESSGGESTKKVGAEDPQEMYSRDREQMERNLDALRRGLKTDSLAHRRDLSKMMRENVMLTKELNALRKDGRAMELQKKAVENTPLGPKTDLTMIMDLLHIKPKKAPAPTTSSKGGIKPGSSGGDAFGTGNEMGATPAIPTAPESRNGPKSRSVALRTTSASGKIDPASQGSRSRNDQWEAWREIQMQNDNMAQLEMHIRALCNHLAIDSDTMLGQIDNSLRTTSF